MAWVTADHPTTDELNSCVQCGLCLPVCPTFRLTGRETASPRGRLHAMSAVGQGLVDVDQTFADIIDFCLGCRACEPVCPGLVPFGRTLEGARAELDAQLPGRSRKYRGMLGSAIASRSLMRAGAGLLSLAQRTRLLTMAPARFRRVADGLRTLAGRPRPTIGHSAGSGELGVAGMLAGCIQDQWFRPVNHAAVTLLEMAGWRVEVPAGQTCCGALSAHGGKADKARKMAERNVKTFNGYDIVVATAAGCSAHMAGYDHWSANGTDVAHSVEDITVAVAGAIDAGFLPTSSTKRGPIAIQDPCHLKHAQRVTEGPRAILRAAGYTIVEIDPVGLCCGAAGLYTIQHPEAAEQLGNQKADQIRSTGLMRVGSANPGCEMQLRSHLEDNYEIAHPIEWYLWAIRADEAGKVKDV